MIPFILCPFVFIYSCTLVKTKWWASKFSLSIKTRLSVNQLSSLLFTDHSKRRWLEAVSYKNNWLLILSFLPCNTFSRYESDYIHFGHFTMIITERFGTDEINYSWILTSVSSFGYIKTKPSFSPRSALGAAKSCCDPTSVLMFSCARWVQPPWAPGAFFTCHSMSLNTSGSSMVGVICQGKSSFTNIFQNEPGKT